MKFVKEIKFSKPPLMFSSWPGMGNVGIIATDYLRKKLEAQVFAEIDMSPFFTPDSIIVKDGIAQLPEMPSSVFHYRYNPDCIVFESNAQNSGKDGILIIKTILEIAQQFNVKRIYTAAAFAQPMSHAAPSQVLCASNNQALLNDLQGHGVIPMPDGYIAGLNGLMLAIAGAREIDAACFLGTIPSYATNISYPKASCAILRTIQNILDIKLDISDLEESAEAMDKQLATIEERIREFFPSAMEKEEEMPDINDEQVPEYIMNRIERLFDVVKKDRSKASELKDELVRWDLFNLYEHRFLDLFKDDENR